LNHRQHAFEIAKDIVIPKSKHLISVCGQALIPYLVGYGFAILPTIRFND